MIGGLALFLYGMHVLGEGLSKASGGRMEQILEKLTSGKWKAVLLGAGVTAVIQSSSATTVMVVGFVNWCGFIQSSSASVGILQALCATGSVSYGTALPIIMGQNIGTCVTALLSSVGTSKNAKRTAIVHLYFNLIGTIVFMIVFYILNAIIGFAFMDSAAQPLGIAVIHTIFNVFATCLLLPLLPDVGETGIFDHQRGCLRAHHSVLYR